MNAAIDTLEPWMHNVLGAASKKVLPSAESLVTRDDLYQEGWLALGKIMRHFDPKRGLTREKYALVMLIRHMRWIMSMLTNCDVIAPKPGVSVKDRAIARRQEPPEEFDPVAAVERSEFSERREGIDAVRALTKGLRPQSVELFRLYYIEGKEQSDIGRELGLFQTAVGKRLRRIRCVVESNARRLTGAA